MPTPIPKAISGANFFQQLDPIVASQGGVAYFRDGDLHYAALDATSRMRVILRDTEELFEDTIRKEQAAFGFKAAINGNNYDLSYVGKMDALAGHDPVPAQETTPKGLVVSGGMIVAGNPEPQRFFIANAFQPPNMNMSVELYKFGFGDPPAGLETSVGGLGPLIINKLKYGTRNLYAAGVSPGAPVIGQPGPEFLPFLTQRSSAHYKDLARFGPNKGKAIIAHATGRKLLLIVQPDSPPKGGITLDALRDKLVGVSVENAIFLDGSDSVMLMVNRDIIIAQGENKDETNRVGLGFGG
jgi:hypothetical protein